MIKPNLIISLLLLASSGVLACNPDQGTGQCGYRGANGAIYNSYGEAQNSYRQQGGMVNNSSTGSVKIIKQPDSFAAMASSTKSGKVATVTHKRSIAEANKEAMKKCEQATGEKCILMHSFQNGCMTAASGMVKKPNGYHLFPASASTGYEAERKAMAACNAAAVDCLPVFEEPICSFS